MNFVQTTYLVHAETALKAWKAALAKHTPSIYFGPPTFKQIYTNIYPNDDAECILKGLKMLFHISGMNYYAYRDICEQFDVPKPQVEAPSNFLNQTMGY